MDLKADSLGFTAADALLYLCASRCGRAVVGKVLVRVTAVAAVIVGFLRYLAS